MAGKPLQLATDLVDLLRFRAETQSERLAYAFVQEGGDDAHLTYAELDRKARALAAVLQAQGAQGERALLLYQPGVEYVVAFFGCLYAGAVAVPAYPPRMNGNLSRLLAVVQDAEAKFALTVSSVLSSLERRMGQEPALAGLQWVVTDDPVHAEDRYASSWSPPQVERESLAFLQYTSGSTSTPKGVMLTHSSLLHNLHMIQERFGTTTQGHGVIWLPPYHDMGLIGGILQPLYTGYPVTLMAPVEFIQRPYRWLEEITRHQATVSGGPNFAYELCVQKITEEQKASLDLQSWELAFSGAEPVRAETLERFAQAFRSCGFRKEAFYPCYGLAEATLFVTGGEQGELPVQQTFAGEALHDNRAEEVPDEQPVEHDQPVQRLVSSGRVFHEEQQVVIADPQSFNLCEEGRVGEIWVAGPSVAKGYWKRPELSAETFGARLAGREEAGPFLRTGDLGFFHGGELYVTGRLKDLIIIRGRNYYPQDIEFTVSESHPAVRSGNGAAFSVEVEGVERLVIVHELERTYRRTNHAEVLEAIQKRVSEEHQLAVHAVVLLKPASIPKTSSGKIQRHLCKQRYLDGGLDVIAIREAGASGSASASSVSTGQSTSATTTMEVLLELVSKAVQVSPADIRPGESISRLGLDSLAAVELSNQIEERLGVALGLRFLLEGPSLAELVLEIERARQELPLLAQHEPDLGILADSDQPTQLSYGQSAMWVMQRLAPDSLANHLASAAVVRGPLDVEALQNAFFSVVERHSMLRTSFPLREGQPVQVLLADDAPVLQAIDASWWSEEWLQERMLEEAYRPFDLETEPPFRVKLFVRSDQEHVLLVAAHHIAVDFWSFEVLVEELQALYPAWKNGTPPELSTAKRDYRQHVKRQTSVLASEAGDRLLAYWKQKLGGSLPVLQLPTDRPRPAVQTYRGSNASFVLSAELTERLNQTAKQTGVTPYVLLLAAYQTLLSRYTGLTDLLVGSPMSGRGDGKNAGVIGYFSNPVVLRAQVEPRMTFADLLGQVKQTVLEALEHQDFPFPLLVDRLQVKRDPSVSPVFQTMFTWQKSRREQGAGLTGFALGQEGGRLALGDSVLHSFPLPQVSSQFELSLVMAERDGQMAGRFEYNTDLFDHSTMERFVGHWEMLLNGIVDDAAKPVNEYPLLGEPERQRLLVDLNDTARPPLDAVTIHQLFEEQVERTPDRVAVVFEDQTCTFRQLNEQANRLAHRLVRMGVQPEQRVGLFLERSLDLLVALLGIVKAGGTYVPLDPTYPIDRLTYTLEDADVRLLVTQTHLSERLTGSEVTTLYLDCEQAALQMESSDNPEVPMHAHHAAYMIYTSGSTGRPKGVVVEHRNALNFFLGIDHSVGCDQDDVLVAVTSVCFDISVLELFWTLVRGVKVVLLSEQEAAGGLKRGVTAAKSGKGMEFSLYYFASDQGQGDAYKLLIEGAKFADQNGFRAVWTPERHFHQFGGLYPNPSVMASALAMVTRHVELRAGSVVLPLHHPVRVAEEWSVVDRLSNGRVSLSFASGWHADDFIFAPHLYADRKNVMFREIETVKKLWRGERVTLLGGAGQEVQVQTLPRPVQAELPVWVTSGGSAETFIRAGEIGAHVLTHLLGQSVEDVAQNIALYRQALAAHGHDPNQGRVALMLHTFLGEDLDEVREQVREPFTRYLRSSVSLLENLARHLYPDLRLDELPEEDRQTLLSHAFERYFQTSALFGTPESCRELVARLQRIGVDEIACLIDFGVEDQIVLDSLERLNALRADMKADEQEVLTEDFSLTAQVVRHGATMLQCTPSLMRIISADSRSLQALSNMRTILLGGEALSGGLVEQLRNALPETRFFNMYGPTEATVWAMTHDVTANETEIPLGRPIANTQIYLLNDAMQPAPTGVQGEIYIGGHNVVRGYWQRPELTADRFVPNPFSDESGSRLYRTGDLGVYMPDGTLRYRGRIDHQVKVRGFRIELGEIEAVLAQHPAVREAVVIAREEDDGKKLVAYVVSNGSAATTGAEGAELSWEDLRAFVRESVPEYMVPAACVFLPTMPLTPNGKVDRQALPEPGLQRLSAGRAFNAPQTELEQTISAIWQEVLNVERAGLDDNFFELGGHSLLAVQVHRKLEETLQIEMPLLQLFQSPTIRSLAERLGQVGGRDLETVQQGQNRAESRKESMKQRREARANRRRP